MQRPVIADIECQHCYHFFKPKAWIESQYKNACNECGHKGLNVNCGACGELIGEFRDLKKKRKGTAKCPACRTVNKYW